MPGDPRVRPCLGCGRPRHAGAGTCLRCGLKTSTIPVEGPAGGTDWADWGIE